MERAPRILLMNMMPNTVGDSVFLTAMFRIVKNNYPNCFLAVTVAQRLQHLYQNNKYLDKIIVIDDLNKISDPIPKFRKILIYLKIIFNLRKELIKLKFDVCYIFYPLFYLLPIIPFVSGIKERIGFKFRDFRFKFGGSIFNFLLTKEVKFVHWYENPDRHVMESFLDLLKAGGIKVNREDVIEEIFLEKDTVNKIRNILNERKIGLKKGIVCFEAIAKVEAKNWGCEKYARVADYLIEKGYDVLLFGNPMQREANEKLRALTNNRAFNLVGEFTFDEIAVIFSLSKLFISSPSGLSQVAGAVGTAVLEIHGPSSPKHNLPIGRNKSFAVVYKDLPRPPIIDFSYDSPLWKEYYNAITPEQVIANINKHNLI